MIRRRQLVTLLGGVVARLGWGIGRNLVIDYRFGISNVGSWH
jgi:hypothetical protein